ncbi:hypothetical protein CEXT_4441 [Caerostris extrusa]|uniref:Uncharacterized protein n=1 Tax=Caerostris extrusa TaxID=172846 RepID=A0AAV4N0G4_CAEEX|nr:hypothetical protein CEXT_4441 [Caerostris extrusa]
MYADEGAALGISGLIGEEIVDCDAREENELSAHPFPHSVAHPYVIPATKHPTRNIQTPVSALRLPTNVLRAPDCGRNDTL